jgi:hypothetical protein
MWSSIFKFYHIIATPQVLGAYATHPVPGRATNRFTNAVTRQVSSIANGSTPVIAQATINAATTPASEKIMNRPTVSTAVTD